LQKRIIKYFVIGVAIILLAISGVITYGILSWVGLFDYKPKEVIENYNKKPTAFTELVEYFNAVRPKNTRIKIEFESMDNISKVDIRVSGKVIHLKNFSIKSPTVDTLFLLTGWNKSILTELYHKLNAVNCMSIQSNYYMPGENSCEVGLQRRGNGLYYYLIFDPPIADSLKNNFSDDCGRILINNRAAIRWYGGTIGPDCLYGNRQVGK